MEFDLLVSERVTKRLACYIEKWRERLTCWTCGDWSSKIEVMVVHSITSWGESRVPKS